MKLLAIDTSTDACSVALEADGSVLDRHRLAPREHTRLLLPMVSELLAEAGLVLRDLDAFVLCRGPGSFTGLRIAAGVIQGLAFSADRPVVRVSTLAMLAQHRIQLGDARVISALDARMGELYWAAFTADDGGCATLVGDEMVLPPEQVRLPDTGKWVGIGPGFAAYSAILSTLPGIDVSDAESLPRARDALPLAIRDYLAGQAVSPEAAQPVYLRNRVAKTEAERRADANSC